MNKPVYEIPMDGESYPPPGSGRRAQQSNVGTAEFGHLPPPSAAGNYQSAPPPAAPVYDLGAAAPVYDLSAPVAPAAPAPTPAAQQNPYSAAPPPAAAQAAPTLAPPTGAPAFQSAPPPAMPAPAMPAPAMPAPAAAAPAPAFQAAPPSTPAYQAAPPPAAAPAANQAPPPGAQPEKPKLLSDRPPEMGEGQEGSDPDLVAALNAVVGAGASDLHITVNSTPMVRIDGGLKPVPGTTVWDADKVNTALQSILTDHTREIFERELELDFAYTLSETARFRVNFYQQRNVIGAAFRLIPTQIKQLAALGVPEKLSKFAALPRGLVLVTGPTGSGKSTTLAALIDLVNSTRADHIVTVEDPIEFMHANKMSVVNQREVGHDTHSFQNALKHVLRQDPDVILIGELRDLETISVALTAAETGHLVFATLHTQDAAQTIDRIIDVFPPHQQGQVRAQLAATLQGVVCQTLVKKVGGGGRAVATEVLITTPAVSNLIREGKTYQIHSVMQAGRELGMHTMDQHLADLVNAGVISHQSAYDKAHDVEDLKQLIQRLGGGQEQLGAGHGGPNFGDSFSAGRS